MSLKLRTNFESSYAMVPITSLVLPLMAFRDPNENNNTFYCVIPKRNWSAYFDDKINVQPSEETDVMSSTSSDDDRELQSDDDECTVNNYGISKSTFSGKGGEDLADEDSYESISFQK